MPEAICYLCAFKIEQHMSERRVRVRFAPSPTGPLHMGGVRTALYNYLFAKQNGGDFLLRIEDTDQTRYVPGAEAYILESLRWCGMSIDEGPDQGGPHAPYRQSERKPMYRQYAEQLIANGYAYYAFDSAEDLEQMRELAKQAGNANWQYNYITRDRMKNSLSLPAEEVQRRLEAGEAYVIRIKLPRNEEVKFEDRIRGWVSVNTNNMDDKVLFKSDGMPTYHLANVVDDYLMEITHVIRGEEWLPSAPLHVLLYRFLGWESVRPEFAHLPLLLKPDGNGKLSKRDGDRLGFPVFPLEWTNPETGEMSKGYREEGYLPPAFVNMLAFLGWNPGTNQELFSMEELIAAFKLERVSKAGAKFDADKTRWFQQQYLRAKTSEELAEMVRPHLTVGANHPQLGHICNLMKERATFAKDIAEQSTFFFTAPMSYDETTVAKKWNEKSRALLTDLAAALANVVDWNAATLERELQVFMEKNSIGFGAIGLPMRLAVTGQSMGPSMYEICEIIGKEETLNRLQTALAKLP